MRLPVMRCIFCVWRGPWNCQSSWRSSFKRRGVYTPLRCGLWWISNGRFQWSCSNWEQASIWYQAVFAINDSRPVLGIYMSFTVMMVVLKDTSTQSFQICFGGLVANTWSLFSEKDKGYYVKWTFDHRHHSPKTDLATLQVSSTFSLAPLTQKF